MARAARGTLRAFRAISARPSSLTQPMNPLYMKHSVDKGTPGCGEAWTPKPRMPFSRSEGQGNYDIRIKRSGSLLGDEGEPPGEHSYRLSAKEAVCVIQGQGGLFTDSKRCARVLDSGRSDEQPWDPGRPGTSASDRKRVISRKLIISAPLLPTVAAVLSTLGRSESVGIECRMDPMWVGPGDDTPKRCAIQPQFSHYPCIQSIRKREKGSNILSSSPPAAAAAGASGASGGTATVAVTDHFPHQASIGCSVDRNEDQKIGKVAKPRPLVSSSASSLVLDNPGSPYILAEILSYLSVRERHSSAMLVSHLWSSTSVLRAVKHLRLNGLYNITDDDAHRIADQYTSLQSVSLNRCCRIGDSALAAFARAHGDTLSEVK